MNVTCPNCATIYRVDPAKVPEAGVRARCAVCNAVFPVRREAEAGRPADATMPAGAAPSAPPPAPRVDPVRAEPPRAEPPRAEPPKASPARPPQAPSMPARSVEPAAAPPSPPPSAPPSAPSRPMAPQRPANPFARPAAPSGGGAPPAAPTGPAAPVRPASPPPVAAPPVAPAASKPAPTPVPAAPPARPAAPSGARPANPFLSQDPTLKARRLARALISDMVVYHPGKRQEGLRDGNLKELFEEEIKKSWEEYAEQVGREVAESTAYFREALNEILAGGRQMF